MAGDEDPFAGVEAAKERRCEGVKVCYPLYYSFSLADVKQKESAFISMLLSIARICSYF